MYIIFLDLHMLIVLTTISIFAFSFWSYLIMYLAMSIRKSPKLASLITIRSQSTTLDTSQSSIGRKVSVIIPARNEEKMLRKCLDSLIEQDYPNFEIIGVNDSSSDNTGRIIQEYHEANPERMTVVVNAEAKPHDWSGKNWACYQGYLNSTGEIFLFMDADTVLSSPSTISIAVSYLVNEKLDALTVRPKLLCEDYWAKITLPILLTLLHLKYSALRINNPENKKSGYLFGCFYLITKKTYEAIGTHNAVKSEIVEDAALGRKIKKENFSLKAVCGEHHIESVFRGKWNVLQRIVIPRYYKDSTNTYLVISVIFFLTVYPFLVVPISFSTLSLSSNTNSFLVKILVTINLVTIAMLISTSLIQLKFGLFENLIYALASPIGGAIISFGFIFYLIDAKRNNNVVSWRGRKYTYHCSSE
jgi:chlorobactene glucosyltransferase